MLPNNCFPRQGNKILDKQTPLCQQKLQWLLDHDYEIGNHVPEHQSLLDVDNDTFKRQIGEAIVAFQALVPEIEANILNVPWRVPGFSEAPSAVAMAARRVRLPRKADQDHWRGDYRGAAFVRAGEHKLGSHVCLPHPNLHLSRWDQRLVPAIRSSTGGALHKRRKSRPSRFPPNCRKSGGHLRRGESRREGNHSVLGLFVTLTFAHAVYTLSGCACSVRMRSSIEYRNSFSRRLPGSALKSRS